LAQNYSIGTKWTNGDKILALIELNKVYSSVKSSEHFRKIENFSIKFGYCRNLNYNEQSSTTRQVSSKKCVSNPKVSFKFNSVSQKQIESDLSVIIKESNTKKFG
jgi:hypothetical protein